MPGERPGRSWPRPDVWPDDGAHDRVANPTPVLPGAPFRAASHTRSAARLANTLLWLWTCSARQRE
jgi:hypothetical protein